jgi:hypothetical protein
VLEKDKKREPDGSLMDDGNAQPCGLEEELAYWKDVDHIGRNYRQGGDFVKGWIGIRLYHGRKSCIQGMI